MEYFLVLGPVRFRRLLKVVVSQVSGGLSHNMCRAVYCRVHGCAMCEFSSKNLQKFIIARVPNGLNCDIVSCCATEWTMLRRFVIPSAAK